MEDAGIYARESPVLGRCVQLGMASSRVISVSFPESVPADASDDHPLIDRVFDYLRGQEDAFDDVDTAITVPTDQRQVLDAVERISYGETATVQQVARLAGLDPEDEIDAETVRAALRANPVPIFVPDHRVEDAQGATPADVAATLRDLEC